MGCSIFIASSTTSTSPSATVWPSSTATLTIVPCIGAVTPLPPAAPSPAPRCWRLRRWRTAACGARREAGRLISTRRPSTSTTTASRSSGSSGCAGSGAAGRSPVNSVSIQVVCTEKGSSASSGVKAGSSITARWKGSTVGMPSMRNSARARRERSIASCRVAPVTMSLASIESKAPETSSPARTPDSIRTPGPEGTS